MELRELIAHTGGMEGILLALFLLATVLQSIYYLGTYLKVPLHRPSSGTSAPQGVSVIICARNEAGNLERHLPKVLEQDFHEFEVVVVNDRSTDQTEQVLGRLSANHSHLRTTFLPEQRTSAHHKKLALTIGIKSARYDHVVLTDADCYPVSDQWLTSMASHFTSGKKIVLGYGGYERRPGLLNLLIRYETVFTAIQYLSCALRGNPYMGIGRNLAYEKDLFFRNKGFASHYHLASGDDDLFVNEVATGGNTSVEYSRESHTRSVPETSLRGWIAQKQRHVLAGSRYRSSSRVHLAGEWISRIAWYVTFAVLLGMHTPWKGFAIVLFILLWLTRLVIFKWGMRRLDERYLLLPSLLFDPVMPLILGFIWFSNIFVTRYQPWS